MRWSTLLQSVAIGSLPFLSGPLQAATVNAADQSLLQQARQLFQPLPASMASAAHPLTPALVALGRDLFFDPRISLDGTVSCAKCHQAALYGTDALPKSIGVKDRLNPRNAPTVLNAALQIAEHWQGNRKDVEDQATQALVGPPSYGNPDYGAAMAKLKAIPGYSPLFQQAFPGEENPITPQNWGRAIGAYERTLVTPSPFDAYLKGDNGALTLTARKGLRDFIAAGCAGCHSGVNVGGGMFTKFGITEPYWKATGSKEIDKGRIDVTQNPADLYVFKVPALRNVAMTAPYFHDGSVATLPEAVRVMAKVQLGRELTDQQVKDIVSFLDSLTGSLPKDFAEAPILPPGAFPGSLPAASSAD
ncbi:cytochrome-c peroxidase [Acidithiobacillus sulfuriphilus]|uniref:Cytochrome-c peroxidase n=2 Tax=Acidithiobacillus sulfuriphilus TaxID=1867749 RepID=A0A3M8QXU8_9PROT|nr:cytochrome c peroxidase [Acidithiobacillus sulfuriphilus]RNF59734.1 cytochrome-c peroxidase [Acidithiobacillus sulfuriphilus]